MENQPITNDFDASQSASRLDLALNEQLIIVPVEFDHTKFLVEKSVDRKSSHCHKFEIPNVSKDSESITKQAIFDCLKEHSAELVVGQESHQNNELVHFHIFMRTLRPEKNRTIIWKLYSKIADENLRVYFDNCKKPEDAIKYASKEDPKALTLNLKLSSLSVTYQTYNYSENHENIDLSDPRLIADGNLLKKVQTSHKAIREKVEKMKPLLPIRYYSKKFNDHTDKFIEWLNGFIEKGWSFKRPQCYIYGPSGVGKTTMVNNCLGAYAKWRYTPPHGKDNRFMWSEWNPKNKNHVVIDEFKIENYSQADLNLLLSGELLVTDQKFRNQNKIYMHCPIIIISNYPPDKSMLGFFERLTVIHVENKGTQIRDIRNWIHYDNKVTRLPLTFTKHRPKHGLLKIKPLEFEKECEEYTRKHDEEVQNESDLSNVEEEDGNWSDENDDFNVMTPSTSCHESALTSTPAYLPGNSLIRIKRDLESSIDTYSAKELRDTLNKFLQNPDSFEINQCEGSDEVAQSVCEESIAQDESFTQSQENVEDVDERSTGNEVPTHISKKKLKRSNTSATLRKLRKSSRQRKQKSF